MRLLAPRVSGVLMLGVFSLNAYVGMKDTTMFQLQPVHQGANFIIAALDFIAAAFLLYYGQGKRIWTLLAGVIWPAVYLFLLLVDIESRLCLFTGQHCFSSVKVSFEYLILGDSSQGWVLWPFTMPTAIVVLLVILVLSSLHYVKYKPTEKAQLSETQSFSL